MSCWLGWQPQGKKSFSPSCQLASSGASNVFPGGGIIVRYRGQRSRNRAQCPQRCVQICLCLPACLILVSALRLAPALYTAHSTRMPSVKLPNLLSHSNFQPMEDKHTRGQQHAIGCKAGHRRPMISPGGREGRGSDCSPSISRNC